MRSLLKRLSSEKKTSESNQRKDSHTGSKWTKASKDLGFLTSGYAKGYSELTKELDTHRPGENYDLWWRTQGNEISAKIVNKAPTFDAVQMVNGHIGTLRINAADLSDEDKSKKFWDHLISLVKPQSEEGDWKDNW